MSHFPLSAPRIWVRTPNWLGDVVMSFGFFDALRRAFPEAFILAICKKEIADLLFDHPAVSDVVGFSKKDHPHLFGIRSFMSSLRTTRRGSPDCFISLPESFSSAWMAWHSKAKIRIGFSGEALRRVFFTHSIPKPKSLHRSEEYAVLAHRCADLLSGSSGKALSSILEVRLNPIQDTFLGEVQGRHKVVLNLNSESQSKVVPLRRGLELAEGLLAHSNTVVILTGAPKERTYTESLHAMISRPERVINVAGKTTVRQLASLLKACDLVISTDSGSAHLANAVGTPTIVLYGAGDEHNTSPYHHQNSQGYRVQGLACAPCISTVCRYGEPKCLADISSNTILDMAMPFLTASPPDQLNCSRSASGNS